MSRKRRGKGTAHKGVQLPPRGPARLLQPATRPELGAESWGGKCAKLSEKQVSRGHCPVEFTVARGRPHLRFCVAHKKAGFLVPVEDAREAHQYAKRVCACWRRSRKKDLAERMEDCIHKVRRSIGPVAFGGGLGGLQGDRRCQHDYQWRGTTRVFTASGEPRNASIFVCQKCGKRLIGQDKVVNYRGQLIRRIYPVGKQ